MCYLDFLEKYSHCLQRVPSWTILTQSFRKVGFLLPDEVGSFFQDIQKSLLSNMGTETKQYVYFNFILQSLDILKVHAACKF